MEISGSRQNFELAIESVVETELQKFQNGAFDTKMLDQLKNEMLKTGYERLVREMIPVYKDLFSEKQIDGLITFFKSDLGADLVSKMPQIVDKAIEKGEKISNGLSLEVVERVMLSNPEVSAKGGEKEADPCARLRTGTFKSYPMTFGESLTVNVTRDEQFQIEQVRGQSYKFGLEWGDGCTYRLYDLSEDGQYIETDVAEVQIFDITPVSYRYKARIIGKDIESEGRVEIVKGGN